MRNNFKLHTDEGEDIVQLYKKKISSLEEIIQLLSDIKHLGMKLMKHQVSPNNIYLKHPIKKRLTQREESLLEWIYLGKTNHEISMILNISPETVKQHISNVMRKYGVINRVQLAVKIAESKFSDSESDKIIQNET